MGVHWNAIARHWISKIPESSSPELPPESTESLSNSSGTIRFKNRSIDKRPTFERQWDRPETIPVREIGSQICDRKDPETRIPKEL